MRWQAPHLITASPGHQYQIALGGPLMKQAFSPQPHFILGGPPGFDNGVPGTPVSSHWFPTPQICYLAKAYEASSDRMDSMELCHIGYLWVSSQ